MAVQTKHSRSKDKSNGKCVDVHYITVTKGNRKGAAEHFGGRLFLEDRLHPNGWYITLKTQTAGGRPQLFDIIQGDIVFRTGQNTRWQVLPRVAFKKRFPEVKL